MFNEFLRFDIIDALISDLFITTYYYYIFLFRYIRYIRIWYCR